jgi:hypothetical protein
MVPELPASRFEDGIGQQQIEPASLLALAQDDL